MGPQKEIEILKNEDKANIIDLYYFDEFDFTGVSEIPYAWQDEDEQFLLPSGKTSRINILYNPHVIANKTIYFYTLGPLTSQ